MKTIGQFFNFPLSQFFKDKEVRKSIKNIVGSSTSSSTGSSTSTPILASPDNSQWLLTVTNEGALATEKLVNTVGASALTSLTLTSPDNTQWTVSVNNSGALTTTAV